MLLKNVHILTGDHPGTARTIAQDIGILPHNLYHYSQDVVDSMDQAVEVSRDYPVVITN